MSSRFYTFSSTFLLIAFMAILMSHHSKAHAENMNNKCFTDSENVTFSLHKKFTNKKTIALFSYLLTGTEDNIDARFIAIDNKNKTFSVKANTANPYLERSKPLIYVSALEHNQTSMFKSECTTTHYNSTEGPNIIHTDLNMLQPEILDEVLRVNAAQGFTLNKQDVEQIQYFLILETKPGFMMLPLARLEKSNKSK
jgi:hypothetical protein